MFLGPKPSRTNCARRDSRGTSRRCHQFTAGSITGSFSGRFEQLETRQVLNAGPIDVSALDGDIVYAATQSYSFTGERDDAVEIPHADVLALTDGTVALEFSVDETSGRQTLFSKDHSGFENGGHLDGLDRRGPG